VNEVRAFSGHRMVTDPSGDDRCLGCGWDGTGRIGECRPDAPRCERCKAAPSDTFETIGGEVFHYCAPCRLGLT
jgi:hypothetical protein